MTFLLTLPFTVLAWAARFVLRRPLLLAVALVSFGAGLTVQARLAAPPPASPAALRAAPAAAVHVRNTRPVGAVPTVTAAGPVSVFDP